MAEGGAPSVEAASRILKRPDSGTDTHRVSRTPETPREADPGFVLIVDDEPLLLRSLRRILESDSQRCALSQDPDRLDEFLENPALDLVLLDLVMGRTSGLDVLDRVKRERPEVEAIMMTGHASTQSAGGCMRIYHAP